MKHTRLALAISLSLILPLKALADTSTIVDSINQNIQKMSHSVDEYKQIEVDFQSAVKIQQNLNEMVNNGTPMDQISLVANRMIQKKLSGINAASDKFTEVAEKVTAVEGLLDQLISELKNKNPKADYQQMDAARRAAAGIQLGRLFQTISFLQSNIKDDYDMVELKNLKESLDSEMQNFEQGISGPNMMEGFYGLKKVFNGLGTKLVLEQDKLTRMTDSLKELEFGLIAVKTTEDIAAVVHSINSIFGTIGSLEDIQRTREFSLKLLHRKNGFSNAQLTSSVSASERAERLANGNF